VHVLGVLVWIRVRSERNVVILYIFVCLHVASGNNNRINVKCFIIPCMMST
jgi:hypothetical protein